MKLNNFLRFSVSLFFLAALLGCNNSSSINPPIDLAEIDAEFYKDLSYGKDSNNNFDIFLPHSKTSTPLVIFVHGGGFVGGDKKKAYKGDYPEQIRHFLRNKIAFASINYRFFNNPESKGVMTSLRDAKRCLQFIRYHSNELNIKKERIGMYGSSAGAGISLWLGFHDDMKDLTSEDRINRETTRLQVVGAIEAQATYDLTKWASVVFKPFNISFEQMIQSGNLKAILTFYSVDEISELNSAEMKIYRENIDHLSLMSKDDPPIWIKNSKYGAGIPKTKRELNHHPFHAKVLKDQADKIGLESIFYIPKLGIVDSTEITLVDFMITKLK